MKKKILFVNGHLNVGGVEKSLFDILRNLDYSKYDVDLLLLEDLGDYCKELPPNVNVTYIDTKKIFGPIISTLSNLIKMRDIVGVVSRLIILFSNLISPKLLFLFRSVWNLNKEYDYAIAFRVGFCAKIVAYCIKSNCKICWWHHGECSFDKKIIKDIDNDFKSFDKVVAVSNSSKELVKTYFNNLVNKIIVIPNMIDTDFIKIKSTDFTNFDYNFDKSKVNIITVSRFAKEKNLINVVKITKMLLSKGFYNFVWNVIGDGEEFDIINNEINKENFGKYINLLGSKDNPFPYISNSDIMVHTSLVESQCLSVLEAMSLGVPCIVTDSLGPREFIKSYENGILTSSNPREIADLIILITEDINLQSKIRINSADVVNDLYSKKVILNKIEKILK